MRYIIIIAMLLVGVSLSAQETSYICADSTKTLTATGSGGTAPYTYSWTKPGGGTVSNQSVTADTSGTYIWTATDSNGCSATGTHTVNFIADPMSGVTINATNACIGTAQVITATGVPSGFTYSWDFGVDASPATSTTPSTSVAYSSSGSKTITLTLTKASSGTANGCDASCSWSKTKTITIGSISGSSSCN